MEAVSDLLPEGALLAGHRDSAVDLAHGAEEQHHAHDNRDDDQ